MSFSRTPSIVAIAIALVAVGTVQSQATTTPAPKPALSAAPHRGGFGGGQNSPAFAKYQACLTKAGIKLPAFGGFGGPNGRGTRPTGSPTSNPTPRPRQSLALTPAQQKAFAACAPLRPSFSGFGGRGGPPSTKPS